jgi:hypothetical protein
MAALQEGIWNLAVLSTWTSYIEEFVKVNGSSCLPVTLYS